MAFEKDPNELGVVWIKTWADGGQSFSGKKFDIPTGLYQLVNFSFISKKDGATMHGIRVVRADEQDIEAEKVPSFADLDGDKAPW